MSENNMGASRLSEGAIALRTIVVGGLTVGFLDCMAANINILRRGRSPKLVWQYVASGLLGDDSYTYGWKSVLFGLLIHFFIAFSVVTFYYFLSRKFPILIRKALLFGPLYGIGVFFFMGRVIAPLSRAARGTFSLSAMLNGLFVHIICVGLPAALIVRWFAKRRAGGV
jgi:hypothetical protein